VLLGLLLRLPLYRRHRQQARGRNPREGEESQGKGTMFPGMAFAQRLHSTGSKLSNPGTDRTPPGLESEVDVAGVTEPSLPGVRWMSSDQMTACQAMRSRGRLTSPLRAGKSGAMEVSNLAGGASRWNSVRGRQPHATVSARPVPAASLRRVAAATIRPVPGACFALSRNPECGV